MQFTKAYSNPRWPWAALVARLMMFAGIQALFALGFLLGSASEPWETSANWWPFVVTITNIICLVVLARLFRQENRRYWDIFHVHHAYLKQDLAALAGILVILGPISYFPNIWLSTWLFGDPQNTLEMLVRPLPIWAAYASVLLFPITQGLVELAIYFAYAMPALESQAVKRWLAVSLPSLFLALQHIAVPLLFNARFILWRGLMFLPFAFLVGIVMRWRPRLLPYLAVIHVLMDMSFAAMLINAAY